MQADSRHVRRRAFALALGALFAWVVGGPVGFAVFLMLAAVGALLGMVWRGSSSHI